MGEMREQWLENSSSRSVCMYIYVCIYIYMIDVDTMQKEEL